MTTDIHPSGTPLALAPNTTIIQKLRMLLGHYDLRVYLSDQGYIDVGRGSFDAVLRTDFVHSGYAGCLGTVGQFCDFAKNCTLLGGGEHHNTLPVNVVLSNVPVLGMTATKRGVASLIASAHQPFSIGNCAIVSADAKVLGGCSIADGTLVAAGSVARGTMQAYSIYGGMPARRLRERVPAETSARLAQVRWWDFDMVYLGNNLARLQELSIDVDAQHVYRRPTPRFVLNIRNPNDAVPQVQVLGFLQDDELKSITAAPEAVKNYILQLGGAGPYHWMPDVWNPV
jgi:acetyltransferase-like isoleucine patch superfamily enzyme